MRWTVLSDIYDWHRKGVTTLGLVKLDVGEIFDLPINRTSLQYLQKTTSTALYVPALSFFASSTVPDYSFMIHS